MNNTLYFESKKKTYNIAKIIIEENNLDLCYNDKNEKIFKNQHMLLSCNKKYIFVHVFGEPNKEILSKITERFYGKMIIK